MKAKRISLFFVAILCTFCAMCLFLPKEETKAESFPQVTMTDRFEKFNIVVSAIGRNGESIQFEKRTIQDETGDVDYYCVNWQDIYYLQFKFSANFLGSPNIYTSYEFLSMHRQSDNLNDKLGEDETKTARLYQGTITNNVFKYFDFDYYIDSDANIIENITQKKGEDFGLYKFDLIYSYTDETGQHKAHADVHIAVLSQDIDTVVDTTGLKLYTNVTSGNELINIYHIYLSNNAFRYVNPNLLTWNVDGRDLQNYEYVLSQEMKDSDPQYANARVLYEKMDNAVGTSFIFDSKGIEGTWNVKLTIHRNHQGDITLYLNNLSTLRVQKKSYLWLILLITAIVIVVSIVITLILLRKKLNKVW